jgi:hypothetical protein
MGQIDISVGSQWYNRIASDISGYKLTLGPKESRKYRLDQLLRIARRVDDFSGICAQCQGYQQEIARMVQDLSLMVQMPDKEGQKKYFKTIASLTEHLKNVHKLVDKGHYIGMGIGIGMAVGAGIGTALGAVLDNPGIGTGIGAGLGLAIGAYLDKKARGEGKVI